MRIIDWNPADGDAYQGDVCLFKIPDDIEISTADEIAPRDNRLILASGEVTGHHHAIYLKYTQVTHFHDEALARDMIAAQAVAGTAKLYRDPKAVAELVSRGELTTPDLAVGFLIIEGGPVVVSHDEHDGIRVLCAPAQRVRCYVGGQREWDAAATRRVAD